MYRKKKKLNKWLDIDFMSSPSLVFFFFFFHSFTAAHLINSFDTWRLCSKDVLMLNKERGGGLEDGSQLQSSVFTQHHYHFWHLIKRLGCCCNNCTYEDFLYIAVEDASLVSYSRWGPLSVCRLSSCVSSLSLSAVLCCRRFAVGLAERQMICPLAHCFPVASSSSLYHSLFLSLS